MLRTFSVERTAQAAAVLLREAEDHRLPCLQLVRLLYLADRESIQDTGFPITGDDVYATHDGLVLSVTLDLLRGRTRSEATREAMPVWRQWIRTVDDSDAELVKDPGFRKLSRYELRKLKETAGRHTGQWDAVRELHRTFPEWQQSFGLDGLPGRIDERTILEAVGLGDRADEIIAEAASYQSLDRTPAAVV